MITFVIKLTISFILIMSQKILIFNHELLWFFLSFSFVLKIMISQTGIIGVYKDSIHIQSCQKLMVYFNPWGLMIVNIIHTDQFIVSSSHIFSSLRYGVLIWFWTIYLFWNKQNQSWTWEIVYWVVIIWYFMMVSTNIFHIILSHFILWNEVG